MKKLILITILATWSIATYAQQKKIDSLFTKLSAAKNVDQAKRLFLQIHSLSGGDAMLLKDGRRNLKAARLSNNSQEQVLALLEISAATQFRNDPPALLDAALQGIRLCKDTKNNNFLPTFLSLAGQAYVIERDFRQAANYAFYAAKLDSATNKISATIHEYSHLETIYVELKMLDSARYFVSQELLLANRLKEQERWSHLAIAYSDMGEVLMSTGRMDSALFYYYKEINVTKQHLDRPFFAYSENNVAKIYMHLGKPDSALKYAQDAYSQWVKDGRWDYVAVSARMLGKLYENRDPQKCIFYLKAQLAAQDSLTSNNKVKQLQLVGDREEQRQQELRAQQEKFDNRIRLYVVVGAAAVLLLIGVILWRNNQRQKQTNALLSAQKEEIEAQRDHLASALESLKTAQTQLVQAEKMASLGELTAGIAHEIQNPLNFVNNFSELSAELIDEMGEELDKGDVAEAQAISADIKQNLEKIRFHGKRADSIVKGMLEHSRSNTGEPQLTNINLLADEFLKLSYHGLRAKDKSFNAELVTNFDPAIPKISVVQQDIGRVLLNVINNAFYAVQQKARTTASYRPMVEIGTARQNGSILISVKDNGTGIPQNIREKIMQPFFTTKPAGLGTGLGLSLSYDIVVKGHGGKIDIESNEGEGSTFIIQLPV